MSYIDVLNVKIKLSDVSMTAKGKTRQAVEEAQDAIEALIDMLSDAAETNHDIYAWLYL